MSAKEIGDGAAVRAWGREAGTERRAMGRATGAFHTAPPAKARTSTHRLNHFVFSSSFSRAAAYKTSASRLTQQLDSIPAVRNLIAVQSVRHRPCLGSQSIHHCSSPRHTKKCALQLEVSQIEG